MKMSIMLRLRNVGPGKWKSYCLKAEKPTERVYSKMKKNQRDGSRTKYSVTCYA